MLNNGKGKEIWVPWQLLFESLDFVQWIFTPLFLSDNNLFFSVHSVFLHQQSQMRQQNHLIIDFFSPSGSLMSAIYDERKDEDGFLYVTYSGENTFG